MRVLVTGCAGFIGMHTAIRLLQNNHTVMGVDNLNDYYDVQLKQARLREISAYQNFNFKKIDVASQTDVLQVFKEYKPQRVIHLAAQAGVRYSLTNPYVYIESNLNGFINILEGCRNYDVDHLVYASSSSVYGSNTSLPFSEVQNIDHPISLYAATKKANELMAHTYSHLYRLPTTGLRFFTVYGPWGRPDMALFKFTKALLNGDPIDLYNSGNMIRDFTYIDDIVEGMLRVADKTATPDSNFCPLNPNPSISNAPYRVFNIGNNNPTPLLDYIKVLEEVLGIKAKTKFMSMQPGDVPATSADVGALGAWVDFKPSTSIQSGIQKFIEWYAGYYGTYISN